MSRNRTDNLLAELRDRAANLGLALTGRCRHCKRPISSLRSLKARSGPVCAAKHKEVEPNGATSDLQAIDS